MIKIPSSSDYITHLLSQAIAQRASDVHFESFGHQVQVRFRIDGHLHTHQTLCPSIYPSIVARLKTLAHLDISQTLRPQDGRLQFIADHPHHIRIHTCPTLYHEKIVLRFLGDAQTVLPLPTLGMNAEQLKDLLNGIEGLQGLILCTGPTGSGKSMTLYSILGELLNRSVQITTIEDPVEIPIPGISQIPIQPKQGMDYAHILKSVLRQDPDVIMLGEIRDEETAQMAIRAALTGHLVLTTLHTRDAQSAITRLLNMRISPYDLADALTLVLAQRLLRTLCTICQGVGCAQCRDGFKGRVGIFELIPITLQERASLIKQSPLIPTFTLKEAGAHLIAQGISTEQELLSHGL